MDVSQSGRSALDGLAYFARVTSRDGRAIEESLAGATLLDDGARLDGTIIEASYAVEQPPLLKRLGNDSVTRIFEPQSLRFVGQNFLETDALMRLPYAPKKPITAQSFGIEEARALSRDVLVFGQERGADAHLAPGLPLFDSDADLWLRHNDALLAAAAAVNGGADVERRPLIAQVAPGTKAMADPQRVINMLLDHPIDGVYVQALRLNPTKDSLEKLARFTEFLLALRDEGFSVLAGRVGAFGLVLQALGINGFDSGLGMAEAHDLASLNRPLTDKAKQRRAEKKGGGPSTRVYLGPLKTTLTAKAASIILEDPSLRHHFACTLGCCRFRALEDLASRARKHYIYERRAEVERARGLPIAAMRLPDIESQLRSASDLATRVRKALPDAGLPDFDHLDRWLGLLAREQDAALAA